MNINESEAKIIIRALDTAEFERGAEDGELNLIQRIRESFPNIDKNLKNTEIRDYLWTEKVEQDPRVQEVRQRFDKVYADIKLRQISGKTGWHRFHDTLDPIAEELQTIKGKVYNELATHHMDL